MRQGFRSGLARAMLALLVVVALAAAGWAHRLPALADRTAATGLVAFLATGGAVDDLCGTETGGVAQRNDCPVCTLPGALPQPVTPQVAQTVARAADHATPAIALLPRAACHPAWNGRAPPVV